MNLLLCTDGHASTRPALEYGAWLAGAAHARSGRCEVVLLGVVEKPSRRPAVEDLLDEAGRRLDAVDVPYCRQWVEGKVEKVVPCQSAGFRLAVVGPMASRLTWAHTLSRILAGTETPVLHVSEARFRLERSLLCTGGLRYAEGVIQTGGWLAQMFGGTVTLFHVVEPITLEYPLANEVKNHWRELLETDTPQGRRLKEALATLREMGVKAEVRVCHGSVVGEILREIREGNYDLVGVGSSYAARSLRRLYRPNVAVEVAEAAGRPVLIARAPQEFLRTPQGS